MNTFDDLLTAVDSARRELERGAERDGADREGDVMSEHLATMRLQLSVAGALRAIDQAACTDAVAAATDAVSAAANVWLDDPVVQERLGRMRLRDQSAAVRCRVSAAADELRRLATSIRAGERQGWNAGSDLDAARGAARRAVHLTQACLEDAALSVRHAG